MKVKEITVTAVIPNTPFYDILASMGIKLNLTGNRYGKLLVIKESDNKKSHWVCRCDCGQITTVYRGHLRDGHTTSCGCYKAESSTKHGLHKTKEYLVWQNIIQRTTNSNHPQYHYWGGRGITVSDDWKDFQNFYRDMGNRPSPKHSIDRIDNNKGYEKGNCRWATGREQNLNTRRTHNITYNGVTMSMIEWAEALDIKYITLCSRINKGWSLDKALVNKSYTGRNQFSKEEL